MARVNIIDSRGNVRTESYRFTVDSKSDPQLAGLKEQIKQHNQFRKRLKQWAQEHEEDSVLSRRYFQRRLDQTPQLRVRLMPRGPRREPARKDMATSRRPETGHRARACAYDCYLPHRHATHFDVYVHEVR